jgi:hypothetical protein
MLPSMGNKHDISVELLPGNPIGGLCFIVFLCSSPSCEQMVNGFNQTRSEELTVYSDLSVCHCPRGKTKALKLE